MNIIIIGNGPAGTSAAGKIKKIMPEAKITIISDENYPYYARPRLQELIANKLPIDRIIVFQNNWYDNNRIDLMLETSVQTVDTKKQIVYAAGKELIYDKLLFATGAKAILPPIEGAHQPNIFTLRTIDDALKIKKSAENIKEIIIIGGGLLGLELANVFIEMKITVKVIEIAPYLLPKQLDINKAKKLQQLLEKRGLIFYLSDSCKKIKFDNNKLCILTEQERKITGDMILISVGSLSEITLAAQIGLSTDKGIIVNQYLQTSHPNIYAAGDCIQYKNKLWGYIKSAIEQGNLAAENMINNNQKVYDDTIIDVTLKITDIDLNLL